jgi:hypothetical protein
MRFRKIGKIRDEELQKLPPPSCVAGANGFCNGDLNKPRIQLPNATESMGSGIWLSPCDAT